MLVRDVMIKNPITADPQDTVEKASKAMKNQDVGMLIICEKTKPVGIITREDIVNRISAENILASDRKLCEIMNMSVITCSPDETLSEIAKKMVGYGYKRFPVVNNEKLVGMISYREIIKATPGEIDVLREKLLIDEPIQQQQMTDGDCESCGNFSATLHSINDRWLCESCKEQ